MFRKYIEAGRVAYVNFGEDYGKLVVIVDFADSKRMLIDGEDLGRTLYPIRRLTLTKFRLPLLRGARTSTVLKAVKAFDLKKKFAETSAARKLAV